MIRWLKWWRRGTQKRRIDYIGPERPEVSICAIVRAHLQAERPSDVEVSLRIGDACVDLIVPRTEADRVPVGEVVRFVLRERSTR